MVGKESAPLKYLLTYKLSQVHLELFFGAIRAAGGFNNNPTTQQFTAAYKRLLLRSHIDGENGNFEKRDPIEILSAVTNSCKINGKDVTMTNAALIRKYDLQERVPMQSENDYCDLPNVVRISEYKEAVISYIAGFVAKAVAKKTPCHKCCHVLGSPDTTASSQILLLKDCGNLYKPSQSVTTVCKETEK